MNFLDLIWLIPLFPLFGALIMLLFGRKLDPQPPSDVMLAPELAQAHAGHEAHGHAVHAHGPSAGHRFVSLFCPGMVLLSFLLSVGAVMQLSGLPGRAHQV